MVTLAAVAVLAIVIALATVGVIRLDPLAIAQSMTYVLVGIAVLYFLGMLAFGGLTGDEKKRIGVIFILFIFAAIFWAAFEQAPTSLNLFARDFTNRTIGGWEVPALWFQSINSAFIIVFAPIFGWMWTSLSGRGVNLSSPSKFALGLVLTAIGFGLMIPAANMILAAGATGRVSAWWLTWSYLFQTFGELSISPVGLSTMTKLSPRKYVGQMMGIWFLATSVGNLIAGLVGGNVDPEKLEQMPKLFMGTAGALAIAAIVIALLIVPIRRMMASTGDRIAAEA
jgi:proton-dependent oligopeptide transporter, POT family